MKYFVEVVYQTIKGNEGTKKTTIEADSPSDALNVITEKVRKYKKCFKIITGNSVLVQ